MIIAVASDHAGFELKEVLRAYLSGLGHEVLDLGTRDKTPVDYPDFAESIGLAIRNGRAERGVLICGSGVGASIAANKIPGIRASLCHDVYSAHQGKEHDDMNVIVFGARVIGQELAKDLLGTYLKAVFSNEERHQRRVDKIKKLENKYGQS